MKQLLICMLLLASVFEQVNAQAPRWVEKAKSAVFSIITYDKNDKILHTGNGFFISEQGEALTDYRIFQGSERAVIINTDGQQMPVDVILGVDEIYDVAHFRVLVNGKKTSSLRLASVPLKADDDIYLLPYSTRKDRSYTIGKVVDADRIEGSYSYYNLRMKFADKMLSCPLMNALGEVVALAQKSSGADSTEVCYGLDASFAQSRRISALSYNSVALRRIGIKKALPDTEEQALVFLLMCASQLTSEQYTNLLNDFIAQYPQSADGYLRRAMLSFSTSTSDESMARVESDLNQALKVARKPDDVYYNRAKIVYEYMLTNPSKPYADWNLDKALRDVRQAVSIEALPLYKQLEGDILFAQAKYAEAYSLYEQVNRTDLASPDTFWRASKAKEQMQMYDEALALADSCIARLTKPFGVDAAPYLWERAALLTRADKPRQAMTDYDAYYEALNGGVNDLFYYHRSHVALSARQNQRALDDMQKAIELNPQEMTYRVELAAMNIRWKRNEEALQILDAVIETDARYAEAYRLKGVVYVQMKRTNEACECFEKAKALGDANADELIQKYCKP